ncbi:MAG: extracellular solute-binding protein [Clostridia bacterium]|nr:extracellular solute-binding protein [Clostridia bacterium]
MKAKQKIALLCAATIVAGSGFGACSSDVEAIDKKKTQLYIANYEAGLGSRWLDDYEAAFEKAYAGESFETGKKGVQVIVSKDKSMYTGDALYNNESMTTGDINLYFCDNVDVYKFQQEGWLADITDVVKETLPGEAKTIEDKLSADQKAGYQVEGKYYALPHYESYKGIVYDVDLFDERGYYFDGDGEILGVPLTEETILSAGPDGKENTLDDGLPATYEQFFALCKFIKNDGVYPIIWTGQYRDSYTQSLLEALAADYEGVAGSKVRYALSETPADASIVTGFDGNGKPIVETKAVSQSNYEELYKLAGTYYSMSFLESILKGNYYHSYSFSDVHSHEMTQYLFLYSRYDSAIVDKPIAMMLEGTWWEEEASSTFKEMAENYDGAGRTDRRFGLMTLPKVDESKIGQTTLIGGSSEMVVNKASSAAQLKAAKAFIKFISTDENLRKFHTMTGVGRAYSYELTSLDLDMLSYSALQLYDNKKSATIAYSDLLSPQISGWYAANKSKLWLYRARKGNSIYYNAIFGLDAGLSAREYFEAVVNYNKK